MDKNQLIALAAAVQALKVIDEFATTENYNRFAANTCYEGIFVKKSATVLDIYKNIDDLSVGFNTLVDLKHGSSNVGSVYKYLFLMINKAKLFYNSGKENIEAVTAFIDEVVAEGVDFYNKEQVLKASDIFVKHIRDLDKTALKIDLTSEEFAKNNENFNIIRALLLAATRALVLFFQVSKDNVYDLYLLDAYTLADIQHAKS